MALSKEEKRKKIAEKRKIAREKRLSENLRKRKLYENQVKNNKLKFNTSEGQCQSENLSITNTRFSERLRTLNKSKSYDDTLRRKQSITGQKKLDLQNISNNLENVLQSQSNVKNLPCSQKNSDTSDLISEFHSKQDIAQSKDCNSTKSINKTILQLKKKCKTIHAREERYRRKIVKLESKIFEQKKRINYWKLKYYRAIKPRQKSIDREVNNTIKKGQEVVKERLRHGLILEKQILENKSKFKTEKEKSMFTHILAGKVIKKYKHMKKTAGLVSTYLLRKNMNCLNVNMGRKTIKRNNVNTNIKNQIRLFLEKNENSILAPGKKDTITKFGKKMQKRYLQDTLQNLYIKFQSETSLKVSQSKFYNDRPFWIVDRKISARDTCLCQLHSNFLFIVQKLAKLKIIPSLKIKNLISSVACDMTAIKCMYRECNICKNKVIDLPNDSRPVFYYQWCKEKVNRMGKKNLLYNVNITSKKRIDCTINELVEKLNSQIPTYLKHSFDIDHQYKFLDTIKKNLDYDEIMIIVDFSENYVCKCAEETQNAHFGASKKQLSLHTGAFFYKEIESNEIKCVSFCTFSECLRHDAAAVWAHMQPVLKLIKNYVPNFKMINFQSDGPSTQYKNKTNFYLFKHYCKILQLNHGTWNITIAGHGKSCADGTGGTVKRLCDRAVVHGKDIASAQDVLTVVDWNKTKIKTFLITEEDILQIDKLIPKDLQAAPNSMKIHQLIWTNIKKETLHINYLSCCECMKKPPCIHYALSPNSYSPSTQLKNNAKRVRSAKNIAVQSSNQIKKISEESSNQKIVKKKKKE